MRKESLKKAKEYETRMLIENIVTYAGLLNYTLIIDSEDDDVLVSNIDIDFKKEIVRIYNNG